MKQPNEKLTFQEELKDEFILFEKLKRDVREYSAIENHLILSLSLALELDSNDVGDWVTHYLDFNDFEESQFEDLIKKLKEVKKKNEK